MELFKEVDPLTGGGGRFTQHELEAEEQDEDRNYENKHQALLGRMFIEPKLSDA